MVEVGTPQDPGHWTVTWVGPLGGTWQLLITDPGGDNKLDEDTKISSAYPHPRKGFLATLDVEMMPGTTWVKEVKKVNGTAATTFSRPMKPWPRASQAPSSLAAS